jgi:hypothetical protein
MFIFIPTSAPKYTAHATGTVDKRVDCEACGTHYSYTLTRVAVGEESYFFLASRASQKATEKAHANLRKILERDHDDVPCPSCGHHQSTMVALVSARSYSELKNLAAAFFLFAGAILAFMLILLAISGSQNRWPTWSVVSGCAIGIGCIVLPGLILRAIRSLLLLSYNPSAADFAPHRNHV